MRLGLGLYFVPLAFIANLHLLTPVTHPVLAAIAFAKIALGLWLLGKSLIAEGSVMIRILSFLVGLIVIFLFGV